MNAWSEYYERMIWSLLYQKVQNMTNKEIIQHIDDGANYYVGLFGEAVHMEKVDKEFYSQENKAYHLFIMCA